MKYKRGYERTDYTGAAVLEFSNRSFTVAIENLSLSGALISKKGLPRMELEEEVVITIPFKNENKKVVLKGRAVRFFDDRVGVAFC